MSDMAPWECVEAWAYAVLHLAMALVVAGVWARAEVHRLMRDGGDDE